VSELDIDQPNTYRIYDYLLGGSFNFAVDRAFAHELLRKVPWARDVARHNRAFLARAVRYAVRAGVRQFVDLGSGIPTVSRTDQVAVAADPRCRVAYVDTNQLAIAHAEVLLDGHRQVAIARTDMRDVDGVFAHPAVHRLLDLTEPVALLMGAVVHFFPDSEDPAGMIDRYRTRVAPGSLLVLSHATYDGVPPEAAEAAPMYRSAPEPMYDRSRAEITALFNGWDLVPPGVVFTAEWHPAHPDEMLAEPNRTIFLSGVAVKR
jgi:O-methyltransferase involved in polyketide biosynthesis